MLLRLILAASLIFGVYFLADSLYLQLQPLEYKIPAQEDWVDYGSIFEAGKIGDWDYQLLGGFTATTIKKDGVFYLYYQGASGYRTWPDETVTWRAIGVAVSEDGVNFKKAPKNPVLTWFPNGNGEEGAVSAGAALDDAGNIIVHYGANTSVNASQVNADVRAAISENGIDFTDVGVVIKHNDRKVWGSRDEIFPIITIHDNDRWVVYYLPNGIVESGWLGVAWGDSYENFTRSKRTRAGFLPVQGWGTGSCAEIGSDKYAIFINNVRKRTIQAHIVSLDNPEKLSLPVETYHFDEILQASIYLDKDRQTWFMFYRAQDYYGVKIAPVKDKDQTPPSKPVGVRAIPLADNHIRISWKPALDLETGVAIYNIYRDGKYLKTVKGWSYNDFSLKELSEYEYQIQAVNYHGFEGSLSQTVSVRTLADKSPPRITSVSGFKDRVTLTFNEPVTEASATNISHYSITPDLSVLDASLGPVGKVVTLTTTKPVPNQVYMLTANSIQDRAATPNFSEVQNIEYVSSEVAGLVGAWSFDEGRGYTAIDTSNYGNHGKMLYRNKPGPKWTDGVAGSAVRFDGDDDQVLIQNGSPLPETFENSYSIVLWVKPQNTPKNITPNDAYYSIFRYGPIKLAYDAQNRFTADIQFTSGNTIIASDIYPPGYWHQVVLVVDSTSGLMRLYVDGYESDQSPVTVKTTDTLSATDSIFIGTSDPLEGRYENRLNGVVDQVKVYSRTITSREVLALFMAEKP